MLHQEARSEVDGSRTQATDGGDLAQGIGRPGNRHPYPVLNPDGEMAYAYYEKLCGWQFDRDFKRSTRMLWLDIEKILPSKED